MLFFIFRPLLLLILSILTRTQPSSSSLDPIQIVSIQTLNTTSNLLLGSMNGGTTLYINGMGFDPTASNNLIYVGTNICNMTKKGGVSSSGDLISCDTTAPTPGSSLTNLPITIFSSGKFPYTYLNPNYLFTYSDSLTPYLYSLYPKSGAGNEQIKFYGVHKISNLGDQTGSGLNMGDIVGLYFGNSLCSRFDINQPNIDPNSPSYITCSVSPMQEGGYYNVTEWLTPGIATNMQRLNYGSILQSINYQFIVIPTISAISTHSGGSQGITLNISGTGFSIYPEKISVSVAGNPCNVITSSGNLISCEVQPDITNGNFGLLLYNGHGTQKNGYLSGTGVFYQRWNTSCLDSRDINTFLKYLAAPNTCLVLLQESIKPDLATPDIYGIQYGQTFKGYFKALTTGMHTFRALADDFIAFYLSNVTASTQSSAINYSNPFISSNLYNQSGSKSDYYFVNWPTLTSTISMNAGDTYYFQAYHVNANDVGYAMISVEVPNDNINLSNQVYPVHMYNTTYVVSPQIISWKLNGANGGTFSFQLLLINPNTLKVAYDVTATGNYNMSAAQFKTFLNNFYIFQNFIFSVTATTLDIHGAVTTDPVLIYTYMWIVTIQDYRPSYIIQYTRTLKINLNSVTGSPTISYNVIQNHSQTISGSFQLSLNGTQIKYYNPTLKVYTLDLPYSMQAVDFQTSLRNSLGYNNIEVDLIIQNNFFENGVSWVVNFVGVHGNLIPTINDIKLLGGIPAQKAQLLFKEVRKWSKNLLIEPITSEYLFTYASKPQVIVNVSGVSSQCRTDCSYQVSTLMTPTLTSVTLNSNVLNITINDPTGLGTLSNTIIKFDTQLCVIGFGSNLNNFSCSLPTNSDGSPIIRTGDFLPVIQLKNIGFVKYTLGLAKITWSLAINQVTPSGSALSGGLPVSIIGTGFPLSLSDTITILMCNTPATILSVSNSIIRILTNPCSTISSSISMTYRQTIQTISYTYSNQQTPTINSISPISASPVLKGTITINGVGFGTILSDIQVYLSNSSGRIYQLNVLSVIDNKIVAYLGGGLPGIYNLDVFLNGMGISVPSNAGVNTFTYELIVTSITPNTGSINGGTLVTITGKNFSPSKIDNQVTVGDILQNWCNIISVTTSTIVCLMPPFSSNTNSLSQSITVLGRAIQQATCSSIASCLFIYDNSTYPTVQNPATLVYNAGDSINLTGTRFVNNNKQPIVNVGGINVTISTSSNLTITFIFPSLPNGTYPLLIYVDGVGYASPTIYLSTLFSLSKTTPISPTSGSVYGNIILLNGNGFVNQSDSKFNFSITASNGNPVYKIIEITPILIKIMLFGNQQETRYTIYIRLSNITLIAAYQSYLSQTFPISLLGSKSISFNSNSQQVVFDISKVPNGLSPSFIMAQQLNQMGSIIGTSIELNFVDLNSNNMTIDGTSLMSGNYSFLVYYNQYGFANISSWLQILPGTLSITPIKSSFNGGILINVTGNGLNMNSVLDVAGINATIIQNLSSNTKLVYMVPPYITPISLSSYKLINQESLDIYGVPIADNKTLQNNAFDSLLGTYYNSNSVQCYIGLDFGAYLKVQISKIRFYPNRLWSSAGKYLIGGGFYGSNDNITWNLIYSIDTTVHTGYNTWRPQNILNSTYRYVVFQHNSTSNCQIAQIQYYGYVYQGFSNSLTSIFADVHFTDGYHTKIWTNTVQYRQDQTPIINSINPINGAPQGGYNITIVGTGFTTNIKSISIIIDGIPCVVQTASLTQIICLSGKLLNLASKNTFDVTINQNRPVILCNNFTYIMRWSDINTWGGDLPPIDGDSIYVPAGMILYVDQSTPKLLTIVVQGSIVFADQSDYIISAGSIIINYGVFRAGTQKSPYTHKLTFVLNGNFEDPQLPGFGNKVIGCHCCQFDMYGKPRSPVWTQLAIGSTIQPGQNTLKLRQAVDWTVGQTIVVASTHMDHRQAEQRNITKIDVTKKIITVDQPFIYKHLSVIENFGTSGDFARMIAEVGLLTRNILVTGDSNSHKNQYGAHIMMHGPSDQGLVSHIAYTQVTECGQPLIVGRYCIHFHLNGDVSQSYVRGNSVHQSYARVITLHGVSYLTVDNNVGYYVQGHNFFIQDGIEAHNVLQNNLAISSIQVWTMLQTDISVASFWITNPLNTFIGNHAAGSDFYGIWYEIKNHPDGLSPTNDICPPGLPLGQASNSVSHSNARFGLRIFKLFSSTYPCLPSRDDTQLDPWEFNPSIQNVFSNFTLYMCNQSGLLAERLGNTIFNNFTIIDSGGAAAQFQIMNFSKQFVQLRNSVIVAQSLSNGLSNNQLIGTRGIITPRTEGFMASNIRFYKFPQQTAVFSACSHCDSTDSRVSTGKSSFFSKIRYSQINGSYVLWNFVRRQIYYDLDGTLTHPFDGQTRTSAVLTAYYPHNDIPYTCVNSSTSVTLWNTSQVCASNVTVRSIAFGNAIPLNQFYNGDMKITRLNTPNDDITSINKGFSDIWVYEANVDKPQTWASAFVMGQIYGIWFMTGTDFTHLSIIPSQYFDATDPGVILRFNYTASRELYDITNFVSGNLTLPMKTPIGQMLDTSNCLSGDYYLDTLNRYLFVCVSGKNKSIANYVELNAISCRYFCQMAANDYTKQPFIRYWSNISQWPNGVLPNSGDNVTINGSWTLIMDINPAPINNLTIDGDVIISNKSLTLIAQFIFIRAGSLTAGTPTSPFAYNFTIILNGSRTSPTYIIDPLTNANKYIVVTEQLNLYGIIPQITWTKLAATAYPGDNFIIVQNSSGWNPGNTICIGPSFQDYTQYENFTIASINGTNISLTSPIIYTHYGDTIPTVQNNFGILDMRAAVGLLDRNIKIVSGTDNGWGFRVLIYGYVDAKNVSWEGNTTLQGVEFIQGGQYDTNYAALQFLNIVLGNDTSLVQGCSFINCGGYCMTLSNSWNISIDNNIMFLGRKYIVYAETMYNYNFTNNLLIGALPRVSMINNNAGDDVSCYNQWMPVNFLNDKNNVQNNLCQGSALEGFVFPHTPCEFLDSNVGFIKNTAGSCVIGFLLNEMPHYQCLGGSNMYAYGNMIGLLTNAPGPIVNYKYLVMADNGRSLGLRMGSQSPNNTAFFSNSWISAIARPLCKYCYGDNATLCKNNHGVRMFVSTVNSQSYPVGFGTNFDVICQQQAFDAKAFISNVTFDNFNQNYLTLPQCQNNFVFRSHPSAEDLTGSHHLYNTSCHNCDTDSYAIFDPPSPSFLGWFGGCGNILCTGKSNYLIHDHDGKFIGFNGTLMANNSVIGGNISNCVYNSIMNGYVCQRQDLAVLEYESIAPDFNKRVVWPVNLSYGNWTTITNGYKQWQWLNNEPLNMRLGRFISIIQLYKIYTMNFSSLPPIDMLFQIQKRSVQGNNSEWAIITIWYQSTNAIQVSVEGKTIPSILASSTQQVIDLKSVCGSNKFYKNGTIQFVVTGDSNCLVRVQLISSIQITATLDMNETTFLNSDGVTSFIDRICSFLNITDTSRLKIVGIYSGSVILDAVLMAESYCTIINSTNNTFDPVVIHANLQTLADMLSVGIQNNSLSFSNLGDILSFSVTVTTIYTNGTVYTPPIIKQQYPPSSINQTQIIIISICAFSGLLIIIGLGLLIFKFLRLRKPIKPDDAQSHQLEMQTGKFPRLQSNDVFRIKDLKKEITIQELA